VTCLASSEASQATAAAMSSASVLLLHQAHRLRQVPERRTGVGRGGQVRADVERDDVGAFGREADRLGPPLASRCTSDENHLALETAGDFR
jgi:hypothetical protein